MGVFRERRSRVINPAASSCRRALNFASGLTPNLANAPLGTGTAAFPVLRALCTNHSHTIALGQFMALHAAAASAKSTTANGSVFLRFAGAAARSSASRCLAQSSTGHLLFCRLRLLLGQELEHVLPDGGAALVSVALGIADDLGVSSQFAGGGGQFAMPDA